MKDTCFLPHQLRDPNHVMTLSQMGSMFPTRLSFIRVLLDRLITEQQSLRTTNWDLDDEGYGRSVLSINYGGRDYSLVAITQPLPPEARSDRVIAERWDAAFVLYDGVPDAENLNRIAKNAPLQEAGQYGPRELCLSRANKSVRLFQSIVDALQNNTSVPTSEILKIGYLMRTTAVYGNGKFGIADRCDIESRPGFEAPFMAEMLTVWLIREFSIRLIEHVGQNPLPGPVKRHLGIGNATGLGMAPFLVSHPLLLHSWMACRETAYARALQAEISPERAAKLIDFSRQISKHLLEWNVADPEAQETIVELRGFWATTMRGLSEDILMEDDALVRLSEMAAQHSPSAEELVLAWVLEAFGDLVDGLRECLSNPNEPRVDGAMSCEDLLQGIDQHWPCIQSLDFSDRKETEQFWYVSEAKLEPRIGQRFDEEGSDREGPLDVARRVCALRTELRGQTGPVWSMLLAYPHHADAVKRTQALMQNPYSEIRDNLISGTVAPIDMLRCKLAMFGASKFDPKSKLWTRITLMAGAPLADEIESGSAVDRTWMPVLAP